MAAGDQDAFLRAILARPDDDLPKLIYADYLDERGDPRAAIIRLQCSLASDLSGQAERRNADLQVRRLMAKYGGPYQGATWLRNTFQQCQVIYRRLTKRVFRLSGWIDARVTFNASAREGNWIYVNGVHAAASGMKAISLSHDFHFNLPSRDAQVDALVEMNLLFGLPGGKFALHAAGVLLYAEG